MKSFRNPVTNVLTAWGYAESNGNDLAREEAEDFNLQPGKWRLDGNAWVPSTPTKVELRTTCTAEYKADIEALKQAWLAAGFAGGASEASKKAALKQQEFDRKAKYFADMATINAMP